MVDFELSCGSFNNFFLNWAFSNESVDNYVSLLAYSVSSINGLKIDLRIPIRVENYNNIGWVQINSNSSCSRRKYEDFLIWVTTLEITDSFISLSRWSLPINSAIFVSSNSQHIIQDVKKPGHLTKYQNFTALLKKSRKKVVKHLKLHWDINNMIAIDKWRTRLNLIKEIWMIANLL